jgi:hypothetical protein
MNYELGPTIEIPQYFVNDGFPEDNEDDTPTIDFN